MNRVWALPVARHGCKRPTDHRGTETSPVSFRPFQRQPPIVPAKPLAAAVAACHVISPRRFGSQGGSRASHTAEVQALCVPASNTALPVCQCRAARGGFGCAGRRGSSWGSGHGALVLWMRPRELHGTLQDGGNRRLEMTFLDGTALTKAMKRLVSKPGKIKIAISYWGRHALTLLNLDTTNKNIVVLCCLKGGKSDPDVIKKFKKRARQCDRLHAKVLWTQNEAIVGSANASSNGMPIDEDFAAGLIEAGVLITDSGELKRIESWFDRYYESQTLSRPIFKADLKAAEIARLPGPWNPQVPNGKRSLLEFLREGGKEELKGIYLVICKEHTTKSEDGSAKRYLKEANAQDELQVGAANINRVSWYRVSNTLPEDAFIIDCYYGTNGITTNGVCKTFPITPNRYIPVNGRQELFAFVFNPKYAHFAYKLTKEDKSVINRETSELWKKGATNNSGRVLSLLDAKPILLSHTE
jgi:hypothetical protein